MRVDFLAEQVCSRVPGGTGRYAAQLLAHLATSASDEHLHLRAVVGRPCARVSDIVPRVRTIGVGGPVLARLWERGLPPTLGPGADVVHAPTLLVPPVRKAALVVTVHDAVPWTHPETLTPRGVSFHRRMAERAMARADLIITPTQRVAHQLAELLDPPCPVQAIPLGVTPMPVPPDAPARRVGLGIGRAPYVLFVGTREPRKGLDVLVTAMGHAELSHLDLVVVGPIGWGDVDVLTASNHAGIGSRVHLLGAVSDEDLAAVYAGAAALALPSRAEGFGIPVIEAMAHGVPVVISDDPSLLETAGGWATISAIGDPDSLAQALVSATSGSAGMTAMVAGAREHADELTWERAAQRTLAAYRTALGRA